MNEFKERKLTYNFVDLSVYKRTNGNEYISLTDYSFSDNIKETVSFDISSEYVLGICTFFKHQGMIAPVTLNELLDLANIHCNKFVKQIQTGMDEDRSDEVIAQICANKIINYAYGKCILLSESEKDKVYEFKRQKFKDGKRVYPTVLKKKFKEVS